MKCVYNCTFHIVKYTEQDDEQISNDVKSKRKEKYSIWYAQKNVIEEFCVVKMNNGLKTIENVYMIS